MRGRNGRHQQVQRWLQPFAKPELHARGPFNRKDRLAGGVARAKRIKAESRETIAALRKELGSFEALLEIEESDAIAAHA